MFLSCISEPVAQSPLAAFETLAYLDPHLRADPGAVLHHLFVVAGCAANPHPDTVCINHCCHNQSFFCLQCKIRHKKEVHETTTCTSVGFSVGSVGFSVGFISATPPKRHFGTLPPVSSHAPWPRSVPTCR